MFTADITVQVLFNIHMAGGNGAVAIAGYAHGVQGNRQINGTHQVAEEGHGPFQDTYQHYLFPFIVPGNFFAQFLHSLFNLFFGNQYGFNIFSQVFHVFGSISLSLKVSVRRRNDFVSSVTLHNRLPLKKAVQ